MGEEILHGPISPLGQFLGQLAVTRAGFRDGGQVSDRHALSIPNLDAKILLLIRNVANDLGKTNTFSRRFGSHHFAPAPANAPSIVIGNLQLRATVRKEGQNFL